MIRLAAKTLSAVEVSRDASHQHEFHAGQLRTALEFPEGRTSGQLNLIFHGGAENEPDSELSGYTLYNAREGKPRAAEYRLYFDSTALQDRAAAGDILILLRSDSDPALQGLVVSASSPLGQLIARILSDDGIELTQQFQRITAAIRSSDVAHLLEDAAAPQRPPDAGLVVGAARQDFLAAAISDRRIPGTRAMSEEAFRVLAELWPGPMDPDDQLYWSLEAETAIFNHLEGEIGQRNLDDLATGGRISIADATALVLARLQSRKSRRGQSLQNHFATLLERHAIPFSAQCRTEHGETPDFIVPGCTPYNDTAFPAERLRMVACKSTVKERWGQILKEADRIPEKYLLTLDDGLTEETIGKMAAHRLSVFLPAPLLARGYGERPGTRSLRTVGMLVELIAGALR